MSRRKPDPRGALAGPSQRQLRAGEVVRHALVEILAREAFREPPLKGASITVGEVRASPDLKHMHVFVAPLLGQGDSQSIAAALQGQAKFLRGRLAREVVLKFTPELHFLPDVSYDEATHINDLLASPKVQRDLKGDDDGQA
ncbi:MAG: 30S ribosome-binding factor RbfA [Caulobacterales bacterium]|jgi:ribosome-binding factor A